jgi:polygalacturonase
MKNRDYIVGFICFSLICSCASKNQSPYNIVHFGAKSDGKTLNTSAIQKAINNCNQNGGGTVIIPAGQFITGAIRLLSNVNLYLDPGARLIGSADTADYRLDGNMHGMIFACKARNISISGEGEINGQGSLFHINGQVHLLRDFDRKFTRQGDLYAPLDIFPPDGPIKYDARPGMMIVFEQCEQVTIKDVILKDSPMWTIRIGDCDDVLVTGISIHNNLLIPNSDGIHCTTSRNIRISDCDIRAGDDAIIVSGFATNVASTGDPFVPEDYTKREFGNKTGYAENVTVTNCILQSRSAGIRVGYGTHSIRNCTFQNVVIYGSNRGIGVFSRDEGSIENILFSDIIIETRIHSGHWWGNGEPVHVSAIAQTQGIPAGIVRNIRFNNITATSETGIVIYGTSETNCLDINLENVHLTIRKSDLEETYGGNFDLRPTLRHEDALFSHDIPGLFACYTDGLTIEDFTLTWEEGLASYFTNGIYCENFSRLEIDGFTGRQAHSGGKDAAISLKNGSDVAIRNFKAEKGCSGFLETSNLKGRLVLTNNELTGN